MWLNTVRFISLLFTALALAPTLAHLLELPNKINLSREDYLTVQQIYRGWALLGIVVIGALISTLGINGYGSQRAKGFYFNLDSLTLYCGNPVSVLDIYLSCQPANKQLDSIARKLAGAS